VARIKSLVEKEGREMAKMRLALFAPAITLLVILLLVPASAKAAGKTVYVGGTMSLTGPYAEDSGACLAGFEDYVKYVNETKRISPWNNEKWPADINVELLWRDDELKPAKALTIYEELKNKGMLVYRVSGSPIALALKDRLNEDHIGATSITSGPFLLTPPQTIFTHYPIYTDSLAAVADWFKEHWKENRKPRLAYLTADNAMGKTVEIPEMEAYLKKEGYEFVGIQYVPLVATSPPTTQLAWLKQNKVDLALGVMINPGTQPTIKEAVRLGMGPDREYKITFAVPNTTQMAVFASKMGELGNGYVSCGSFPPYDETTTPGVAWCNELQKRYRPGKPVANNVYMGGIIEVMTQVEALRLALKEASLEKLKPADVIRNGFYKIKNLDTGGLSSTPLTYGPSKVEGADGVRVDQIQKGKIVKLGVWPCHHIYSK
jgi:branched-chain amino acid transport system substrate-binding protein